jgi:YD repeat-containing protein
MVPFARLLLLLPAVAVTLCASPWCETGPSNALGAANDQGYFQTWRALPDCVDFGGGLHLPARWEFESNRESASPYFGKGWWFPLLEANAFLKRERMMRAILPNGVALYLRRSSADKSKFQSLDGRWQGTLIGDEIVLTHKDGTILRFVQGRMKSLKTASGRVLTWSYNGTVATEIREGGAASSPIRVDFSESGQARGFWINGEFHEIQLDKKPRVEVAAGKPLVAGFDPSLSKWKGPNWEETYVFEVDNQVIPDLSILDASGSLNTYTWDPATKHVRTSSLVEEGDWVYEVGKANGPYAKPPLTRTRLSDNAKEFLIVDDAKGTAEQSLLSRGHTITHVYKSTGPLFGKIYRIEQFDPVTGKFRDILRRAYDASGRLLRKTDAAGFTTLYKYDEKGTLAKQAIEGTRDPTILKALEAKEKNLLAIADITIELSKRDSIFTELGMFYIHELKDCGKALALVPEIYDPTKAFSIRLHAVDHNLSFTPLQKIQGYETLLSEFPERKSTLTHLIEMRKKEHEQHR